MSLKNEQPKNTSPMINNTRLFTYSLLIFVANNIFAQNKTALEYAERLDSLKMKTTLTKLASVEFAGRKSSDNGSKLAADYLMTQLKLNAIKEGSNGSYKQSIEAHNLSKATKYFQLAGFNYNDNYRYSNTAAQDSVIKGSDIVFAGYGINHATYNDFANIDIKDKIVMVMTGDGPTNKYGVRCHGSSDIPNLKYIASQKPKAVLMVRQGFNTFSNYSYDRLSFFWSDEKLSVPTIDINELLANRILEPTNKTIKQIQFETESNCKSSSFEFKSDIAFNGDNSYKLADVNNLVAVIEGTDLKDEYVVLSAHYDHIGTNYRKEVYAGADDNASGVAAVMEIARVLNEAKKAGKGPRRTVIVFLPTAEEDGLCGSDYYCEKPIYPLAKTIACINVDMVGRMGSDVSASDKEQGYIYALTDKYGANDSIFNVPDSINSSSTNLSLLSKDGSSYSSSFSRSDHYNFYNKKVPSIMFTNGSHNDLHATTDVAGKIDFPAMQKRSKLVFLTVWEFANNPKPFRKVATQKTVKEEAVEIMIDSAH
jgi:hypothetical protein